MKTQETIERINDLIVEITEGKHSYYGWDNLPSLIEVQAHLIEANAKAEATSDSLELVKQLKEF